MSGKTSTNITKRVEDASVSNIFIHFHRLLFSGHGVVALELSALELELVLAEMVDWLKQIEVFDGPYCASAGLVLTPLQFPLC